MRRFMLVVALVLSGCATDNVTGSNLTVANLAGSWNMTRLRLVNAADSTQGRDGLPGGTVATLHVSPAGAFTLYVEFPDGSRFVETGTLAVSGDTLSYNGSGDELLFRVVLVGNSMTWRTLETELYDINGDGIPEETYEEVRFVRV